MVPSISRCCKGSPSPPAPSPGAPRKWGWRLSLLCVLRIRWLRQDHAQQQTSPLLGLVVPADPRGGSWGGDCGPWLPGRHGLHAPGVVRVERAGSTCCPGWGNQRVHPRPWPAPPAVPTNEEALVRPGDLVTKRELEHKSARNNVFTKFLLSSLCGCINLLVGLWERRGAY